MVILAYTDKQKQFIEAFMIVVRDRLTQNSGIRDKIGDTLNNLSQGVQSVSTTSQIIHSASTMIGVAGVVAAPATLGTSLAAAGTAITILQTGRAAYQYVADKKMTFASDDLISREAVRLGLEILFEEVGYIACIQYAHFINEKATEKKGVETLAKIAATRFTETWLLLKNNGTPITIDALFDGLTDIVVMPDNAGKVEVEAHVPTDFVYYADGIYARSRAACFDLMTKQWLFYASPIETQNVNYSIASGEKSGSSLKKYGYVALPKEKLRVYSDHLRPALELIQPPLSIQQLSD